jgi:hypothetical protein
MTFLHTAGNMEVGTRIIILKSNNFTNGTPTGVITTPYIKGAWVRVGSQILSSSASSVTFSGLDGDRDVLYYASAQIKATGGSTGGGIRPNNVSSTVYGYQMLSGSNTTVSAARDTAYSGFLSGYSGTSAGNYHFVEHLFFAKTGFVRPNLCITQEDVNGTSIGAVRIFGESWNNTTDNVTSIVFSAGNFDTGSQFDLYALRPNG